ncbi:MAG: hypothetical protein F4Z77_02480, partial [Dehalococcoidia bacterium]|nr:hypothetical protein [Dehalococcoidia bacterium]
TYWQAHHVNELLSATMPVARNNLAYKPAVRPPAGSLEATHTDDRLVILEDSDLHPDVAFVPLNQAEGYGLLRLMEDGDEPRPMDIAIYRSLPNDLPRVAGTITTIPQTPLSHVNLRAIQNSVPNAFIRDILKDETLKALIGKHVYYAVTGEGYTLRAATKKEVDDHHAAARPTATQTPERDLTVTKITALADISFDDWDAFGVKAANMAELSKLSLPAGTVPTGFAVPFYFYDEFMKNAGLSEETLFGKKKWPAADKIMLPAGTKLSAVVTQILAHPRFQADYDIQEEMLDDLRDAIKDADSPDWIIKALEAMHATYPDGQSLRYRSSTNNEDLPAFNGAGLYDSKTQDSDETADDGIDKSIKAVWASLWNFRAFLEREYYRVDHTTTAMGVLVHPNYSDELANGVAVSTDPIRFLDGMYYVNTQVGEDLVTNPEPNSYPEELLLDAKGKPIVLSRSSLSTQGQLLMSDAQMLQLRNNLKTIHDRFKTLYNVQEGDDFAIEIEFKITPENKLAIKQARPWVFAPPLTLTPAVVVPSNSLTARSTKEGRYLVIKLRPLVPDAAVKWSMAGPDTGAFWLWVVNEQRDLYFTPRDYENPEDADGDNVYRIVLTATDPDSGEKTTIDFTVTVVNDPDDDSGDLPVLSVRALPGIVEGGQARFVVTADPAPADWTNVNVRVNQDGNFLWSHTRMITAWLSSSGRATFGLGTRDDKTDEPDGSLSVTLRPGVGYTVSADKGTASVRVADNDGLPSVPEVNIIASQGGSEGEDVTFTLTATPAPTSDLPVPVTVTASGDFGVSAGSQTVTIPTAGSATLTIATTDDDADEPDGSVTLSLTDGDGYIVGPWSTETIAVLDNDNAPQKTEEGAADVDLGEVEVGQRISYVAPSLKPAGAENCGIGAGVLWKRVDGGEVVTRLDNGFSLDYDSGLPRLSGRAKFRAAPTVYRVEYICGYPQSWSGSYTIAVEVIGAGMGFGADSLGQRTLYKGQQRTITPPQLFHAEGAVTYAVIPVLPAGLSLDTATGVISGAPTALQEQITYTVTATDSKVGGAQTATFDVRLSVVLGMHWSVSSMPDMVFEAGERIEIVPPALVNPTTHLRYTYRATHDGVLTMHPSSGRLLASSARPMVKNTYTITAYEDRVYDDRTAQRVSITVNVEVQDVHRLGAGQTVSIPAMALPGLSGTISYALASTPALPSGLSFDSDSGVISGSLDANATQAKQTYTVTGTDANGNTADYRFKIEVRKLVLSGTQSSYSVGAGDPLAISPTHSGGIGVVSYSISPAPSELPGGVSFNAKTGAISGTPPLEFAESTFTVTATDSANPPQTASYSVSIRVNPSAKAPRVSISAGSGVTEGGSATFTVTANPAPSSPLSVNVTVSQDGDYGATTGSRTVTIPTSG